MLESTEVIFRGEFRAKVPFASLTAIGVKAGVLTLTWPEGTLALTLGAQAEKWADTIRNPKSVVEKLGIKPGQKVVVLAGFDAAFKADVAKALGKAPATRATKDADHVFVRLQKPGDEAKVVALKPALAPKGGVWAVYPRGVRELSEDTVRRVARANGLVDVKVVRFSETHGSLRLVARRSAV